MESRWMRRKNENGEEEKFYPITHKDAIVGMEELTANYLPLSGGTITGDVTTKRPIILDRSNGTLGEGRIYKANATTESDICIQDVASDGSKMTLSIDSSKKQLAITVDDSKYDVYSGYNKPTASDVGALPLEGGTLSGNLSFGAGGYIGSSETQSILRHAYNGQDSFLAISEQNELSAGVHFVRSGRKAYKVFGEHNKPSGSYVGNGSATSRTINVGGIGNALLITTNYGDMAIVTKSGALIMKAGTVSGLSSTHAKFSDGILTLATTETALNENSKGCTYQVL